MKPRRFLPKGAAFAETRQLPSEVSELRAEEVTSGQRERVVGSCGRSFCHPEHPLFIYMDDFSIAVDTCEFISPVMLYTKEKKRWLWSHVL